MTQAGEPGANHGHWPYPVYPPNLPDIPHNWLVTAHKEACGGPLGGPAAAQIRSFHRYKGSVKGQSLMSNY